MIWSVMDWIICIPVKRKQSEYRIFWETSLQLFFFSVKFDVFGCEEDKTLTDNIPLNWYDTTETSHIRPVAHEQRQLQSAVPVQTTNYKTDSMLSHVSWSSRLYMNFVLLAGFWVISLPKLSRVTLEAKSSVGVRYPSLFLMYFL